MGGGNRVGVERVNETKSSYCYLLPYLSSGVSLFENVELIVVSLNLSQRSRRVRSPSDDEDADEEE